MEKDYEVNKNNRSVEFQKAFEIIKKDFIDEECKSVNPTFILAGGQPGSGKTAMITTIKNNNLSKKFVVIDLDLFRSYHPDFDEIKKYHKKDGVLLTNSFAFETENELIKYCIQNSYNVINVTTLRNTEMIINNIKNVLIPLGFSIEVYIMAVSPEESHYSTLTRFKEQQTSDNNIVRFNSKKFNDEAYIGLNNTIKSMYYENYPIVICKRAEEKNLPATIVYNGVEEARKTYAELENIINEIRKQSYERVEKNLEKINISFLNDEEYAQNYLNDLIKQVNYKKNSKIYKSR